MFNSVTLCTVPAQRSELKVQSVEAGMTFNGLSHQAALHTW